MTRTSGPTDLALPPDVATHLEELSARLRDAAGNNLLSLVLYGGLARGRYTPGSSDINVVVVLRDASAAAIARISGPLRDSWRAKRVEPFIITPEEISRLAMVFPTKLLDIQRRHVALFGDDPFDGISVSREQIRWRVEQELRNVALRLRRRFVAIHDDPAALAVAADDVAATLAVNLRALLYLEGIVSDEFQPTLAIYQEAAKTFGLDAEALEFARVAHRGPGTATIDAGVFGRLLDTVGRAADVAASLGP